VGVSAVRSGSEGLDLAILRAVERATRPRVGGSIKPGASRAAKGPASDSQVGGPVSQSQGISHAEATTCAPNLPIEHQPVAASYFDCAILGQSVLPNATDTDNIDRRVARFMDRYKVPNGALAIVSADGRLVYAKGFTNLAAYEAAGVEPFYAAADTRFRIGSVSKILTGLTAIKVFQELRLHPDSLDARVGELVDLRSTSFLLERAGAYWPVDSRLQEVRVRHLLTHTAGWFSQTPERDESAREYVNQQQVWPPFRWADEALLSPQYDPTARARYIAQTSNATYPVTADHLQRYGNLAALSWSPGSYYSYNNYGYWLAGQAIEAATCRSYESVVRELLLRPLGMTDTEVGDVERSKRKVGEVPYFSEVWPWQDGAAVDAVYQSTHLEHTYAYPDLPPEYGPYAERLVRLCAATGGWVSSVFDLALLARELFSGTSVALDRTSIGTALLRAVEAGPTGGVTLCGLGWDTGSGGDAVTYNKPGHMESTMAWLYNFGDRSVPGKGATVIYLFNRFTDALDAGGEQRLRTALTGPVPAAPGLVTNLSSWGGLSDDLFP